MNKVNIMRKMDQDGLLLCDLQGNAFELSIQLTSTSSEIFMRRFMNSKMVKMIDNESVLQMNIQPKDIIKWVEEEYKESKYGSVKYTKNEMYWIGYLYRYWHFYKNESSVKIYKQAPAKIMKRNYLIFHTMAPELAIDDLKEINEQKGKVNNRDIL